MSQNPESQSGDPPSETGKFSKVEQHRKEFLDKALNLMENGKMFWQRPWDVRGIMPVNAVTKKEYKGCNIAYLLTAGTISSYNDPRWVTYKQAQENGWHVRKGEKGTKIEFWSAIQKSDPDKGCDEDSDENRPYLYCKIYTVFNASQVEGIPPLEKKEQDKKSFIPHEKSERIMNNCGVPILYGDMEAYYVPVLDVIHMPTKERFHDEAHFYATTLHEIAHSTGHAGRLNRDLSGNMRSPKYAQEELRAEMASAFMQMELGFPLTEEGMKDHMEKHAAYLQHWLSHLKDDYKEFFKATRDAVKIADYVLAYDKERIRTHEADQNPVPQVKALACGVFRSELIIYQPARSQQRQTRNRRAQEVQIGSRCM
jgi:antirestriction protein ArdC